MTPEICGTPGGIKNMNGITGVRVLLPHWRIKNKTKAKNSFSIETIKSNGGRSEKEKKREGELSTLSQLRKITFS